MKLPEIIKRLRLKKFLRLRWLMLAAVIALLVLLGVMIWRFRLVERADSLANLVVARVSPKSTVVVSSEQASASEEARLSLHFSILDKDQARFDALANEIGLGAQWPKEISLGIDEETANWLTGLLPLNLSLNLTGSELTFGNLTLQGLVSSRVRSNYIYATESASLNLKMSGVDDIDLVVNKPEVLMEEASKSGELYVSPVLREMQKTFTAIDELNLRIVGRRVSGFVKFK